MSSKPIYNTAANPTGPTGEAGLQQVRTARSLSSDLDMCMRLASRTPFASAAWNQLLPYPTGPLPHYG
eukprot:361279-Chlamydomonas_euryale.AAC.2